MLDIRLIEKIEEVIEIIKIKVIIIIGCHGIRLINIRTSLNKLMEGGAEILIAKKINHQNVRFGIIFIIPLKDKILRV